MVQAAQTMMASSAIDTNISCVYGAGLGTIVFTEL